MTCPKCNKEIIEADIEVTRAYCRPCMEWFSIKTDVTVGNMSKDASFRSNYNAPQENIMNTDTQKRKSFLSGGLIGPFELKYEEIPFYRKR
jgi:acetyl-CoA carboxylase beta subunit